MKLERSNKVLVRIMSSVVIAAAVGWIGWIVSELRDGGRERTSNRERIGRNEVSVDGVKEQVKILRAETKESFNRLIDKVDSIYRAVKD